MSVHSADLLAVKRRVPPELSAVFDQPWFRLCQDGESRFVGKPLPLQPGFGCSRNFAGFFWALSRSCANQVEQASPWRYTETMPSTKPEFRISQVAAAPSRSIQGNLPVCALSRLHIAIRLFNMPLEALGSCLEPEVRNAGAVPACFTWHVFW